MPGQTGQKDQALTSGRIAYGYDGTNSFPLLIDSSGRIILPASTVAIGKVDVRNTETIQTELYAAASLAASSQALSSVISLIGIKQATFFIDHGRAATGAFGTNGTEYRIEGSQKAAGNDTWVPLVSYLAQSAVAMSAAASGNHAAGAGTITILSGTATAAGSLLFWANTASAGSSEWLKVTAITGTASFNIQDALTNAQSAAVSIYSQAERIPLSLNVESITRARVVINNNASGTTQAIYSRIACITEL